MMNWKVHILKKILKNQKIYFDTDELLDDEEELYDSDLAADNIYNDEDLSEEDK